MGKYFDGLFIYSTIPLILLILFCTLISIDCIWKRVEDKYIYVIKRFYYLFCILWFYIFVVNNNDKIKNLGISSQFGISSIVWSYIIITITYLAAILIIDWLVIVPKSIEEISLIGNKVKITSNDRKMVAIADKTYEKKIATFQSIASSQYETLHKFNEYIKTSNFLLGSMYQHLINIYCIERKNISYDYFEFNRESIKEICLKYKANEKNINQIENELMDKQFYIIQLDNDNYSVIDVVVFKYTVLIPEELDILIVLYGEIIPIEEYYIIGNLITCSQLALVNYVNIENGE